MARQADGAPERATHATRPSVRKTANRQGRYAAEHMPPDNERSAERAEKRQASRRARQRQAVTRRQAARRLSGNQRAGRTVTRTDWHAETHADRQCDGMKGRTASTATSGHEADEDDSPPSGSLACRDTTSTTRSERGANAVHGAWIARSMTRCGHDGRHRAGMAGTTRRRQANVERVQADMTAGTEQSWHRHGHGATMSGKVGRHRKLHYNGQ